MSELQRQKTVDMDEDEPKVWGKLIPLASGLSTQQLSYLCTLIGRTKQCQIQINDKRLSSKHCEIQNRGQQIFIKDLSTNGTYLKDAKIGKNKEVKLEEGEQIWLLPASKVNVTQSLGFKLELIGDNKDNMRSSKKKQKQKQEKEKEKEKEEKERQKEEENKKKDEENQKKKQEDEKKIKQLKEQKAKVQKFSQSIKDQITCAFCFEIMHGPVSVQPCNHRFCGGCLSDLVQKKKGDCISCRKTILTAVKDSSFNSIIDDYLKTNPEDKRETKEIQELNNKNIFTFDPTDVVQLITGKVPKKAPVRATTATRARRGRTIARVSSDLSASDSEGDGPRCRQCMNERNGFRCNASQKHVGCFTCGKLMADRQNKDLHQYCVLCTQYFCSVYYPPCGRGVKLQLMRNRRNQSKVDAELMRGNKFEFESFRNYLMNKRLTSKDIFDDVMKEIRKGGFSYVFDRKIMRVPPTNSREVKMGENDAVCDLCWKDLWFQMVFFYRSRITPDMPRQVRDRPPCYWGINCRTVDHNADHAKRYNHIVFQTRF